MRTRKIRRRKICLFVCVELDCLSVVFLLLIHQEYVHLCLHVRRQHVKATVQITNQLHQVIYQIHEFYVKQDDHSPFKKKIHDQFLLFIQLRENPLFTRAKQNFAKESNSPRPTETVTYVRLDKCAETSEQLSTNQLETIIMLPNELDSILGKRTQQIKTRPYTKILHPPMEIHRQSELELIFQVDSKKKLGILFLFEFVFDFVETCTTERAKFDMTYFLYTCVLKSTTTKRVTSQS